MILCGLKYGAGYVDYQLYEFYNRNKRQRKDCMTREKNNRIMKTYNHPDYTKFFDDKGLFYKTFDSYLMRKWADIRYDTDNASLSFMKASSDYLLKPAVGSGGKGIEKITFDGDYQNLKNTMHLNSQDLVEEMLLQHKALSDVFPYSINSLRLYTFFDGKNGHVLQRVIKFGNGKSVVDNFSSGGMYTFLNQNGEALYPAVDENDTIYDKHPITKYPFQNLKVPFYKEAEQLVTDAAKVIPQMGYIGWDVAITPNGPAIIEGNHYPGTFEPKARFLSPDETGSLPEYRKYMTIKL